MTAEQERVLEGSQAESDEGVCPESDCHGSDRPRTIRVILLIRFYDIFLRSGNDCSDRQEEGSEEESFTFVFDRFLEGSSVLGEAEDHCHCDGSEQHEVENVENGADGDETGERMGLDGDKRAETTSSHRQGVVRPCVVLEPLSESEVWLVGILPARDLGVLVPFRVAIGMLVLLEIDIVHLGWRLRRLVPERVLWLWLPLLRVDAVSISINRTGKVASSIRCVHRRRCCCW